MARKVGSKDKQKRKSRLTQFITGRNVATGALIGLGAIAGGEGLYRYRDNKILKQIQDKQFRRTLLQKKFGTNGNKYLKEIADLQSKRNSKKFKYGTRAIGAAAGGVGGYAVAKVVVPEDKDQNIGTPRKGLAHINSTSRELRGWANLAVRLAKL